MTTQRTIFCDVALPAERTLLDKLTAVRLPEAVTFQDTSFFDAVGFLRTLGYALDVEEADEPQRGVPVWIGVHANAPLILGEPGESQALEHWIGKLRFSATFLEGTCLGSAWQTLAEVFGLEMHLHEEAGKLILWLPTTFPGGDLNSDSLLLLRLEIDLSRSMLPAHKYRVPR